MKFFGEGSGWCLTEVRWCGGEHARERWYDGRQLFLVCFLSSNLGFFPTLQFTFIYIIIMKKQTLRCRLDKASNEVNFTSNCKFYPIEYWNVDSYRLWQWDLISIVENDAEFFHVYESNEIVTKKYSFQRPCKKNLSVSRSQTVSLPDVWLKPPKKYCSDG